MTLAFSLDRTVVIRAQRATVFRFFTDTARFARWWGSGSMIEAVVGGPVKIRYPDGTTASGVVREIVADQRIAFTYGYDDPEKSIPPGGSLVTITLDEVADGTQVKLHHDVAAAKIVDEHVQGWRYMLAVFAKVATDEAYAAAGDTIATWFACWNETSAERCRAQLATILVPDVAFRDAYSCAVGLDELAIHIGACQRFMPGIRLEPRGQVRQAHGTALIDWAMVKPDASVALVGTNVVRFAGDGRIADVVGIANPSITA